MARPGFRIAVFATLLALLVVLLGAWRHLVAVAGSRAPRQDPGALARLTGIPAAIWTLLFALILGACSWWAGRVIVAGLG